jgi:release factor glutamine methyltransferase
MQLDPELAIDECDDVYPPREDTFLLLECIEAKAGQRILEMGCGSGLLSVACAKFGAIVVAADINQKAVACTLANLKRNRLQATVLESDLFSNVEGRFDLMVFNPPYLVGAGEGELERSWAGGKDGVQILERFLRDAPDHLLAEGRMVVLLSTMMNRASLENVLMPFERRRLGSKRLFFEELWVEELSPSVR